MKSKIFDKQLLAEIEESGESPRVGLLDRLFGGRWHRASIREAFRSGRYAIEMQPQFLHAKLERCDAEISHKVLTLRGRKSELERQSREWRAWVGHVLAIIIGFGILALALRVDYSIIHEFWTRSLANEFGEVPRSLASSVFFKSAQVIFATLAFHLFIETIGPVGRKVFIVFIFTLTFAMLLGIGVIIANRWLPAGSQLFGIDLSQAVESSQDMLASIGLGAPAAEAVAGTVAPGPITEGDVRTAQTLIWFGSLSLIFIIVTGVGALCMRFGIHGFQGIFGDITFDSRHRGAARLSFRADELVRVQNALNHFSKPKSRANLINAYLSELVDSYLRGLWKFQAAWGFMGNRERQDVAHERLTQLNEVVKEVKREWTEQKLSERHEHDEELADGKKGRNEQRPDEPWAERNEPPLAASHRIRLSGGTQEERKEPALGDENVIRLFKSERSSMQG
jgi:hypothetical protein